MSLSLAVTGAVQQTREPPELTWPGDFRSLGDRWVSVSEVYVSHRITCRKQDAPPALKVAARAMVPGLHNIMKSFGTLARVDLHVLAMQLGRLMAFRRE
mmetsp:Transcript_7236/g.18055  ORF Transcript_7236/g.18055 Transcript_7236/m.18055 type:complete len:99 (-) Transcript_7236:134-430(-)